MTLGARETGTARLDQAVAAYRDALEERTRNRVPLDWAVTQVNLAARARRNRSPDRWRFLDEALAAIDGALEVFRNSGATAYIEMAEYNRCLITGENPA